MAEAKEGTAHHARKGHLTKEEKRKLVTGAARRRRAATAFAPRGSIFEGLYQAGLETLLAATDVLQGTMRGIVGRDRRYRGRGRYGRGYVVDNWYDAGHDAIDGIVDMPRRAWEAYLDGTESADEADEEFEEEVADEEDDAAPR